LISELHGVSFLYKLRKIHPTCGKCQNSKRILRVYIVAFPEHKSCVNGTKPTNYIIIYKIQHVHIQYLQQ